MSVFELGQELGELSGEYGELSGEFGELGELSGEYGEMSGEFGELSGEFGELSGEAFLGDIVGGLFGEMSETQELELASELLEIGNEAELEQFLGNLIKGAAKAVGGFVKSPVGKALGGVLKNVAKKALPVAAGALGNFIVPGVGGLVGSKLGSMASNLFELELESLNEAEAELEVARRVVRLAHAAGAHAARAPQHANPTAVARAAIAAAARQHAPGLARQVGGGGAHRPMLRDAHGRFVSPTAVQRAVARGIPVSQVLGSRRGVAAAVAARPHHRHHRPGYAAPAYGGAPTYGGGVPAVAGYGAAVPTGGGVGWPGTAVGGGGWTATGQWYRRGSKILLVGV